MTPSLKAQPLISVVLGVRNAGDCVLATLDSVRDQQGVAMEVLVVDDGSSDSTAELVRGVARADSRVRVLHQAASGLTRALRHGCSEARGEIIARIDAGDRMSPGRLARQLAVMETDPEVVVLGSLTRLCGPAGEALAVDGEARPGIVTDLTAGFAGEQAERLSGLSHPSVCFRLSAYRAAGGYRPALALSQDVDLGARIAQYGSVSRLEEVLTQVQVGLDSLSPRHHRSQTVLRTIAASCAGIRRRGGDDAVELERAAAVSNAALSASRRDGSGAYFIACCLARRGDLNAAEAYYRVAMQRDPVRVRPLLGLMRTRTRRALSRIGVMPAPAPGRQS
jgi:glycosyltransferase involved in cell wall biosynthesis